MLRITPSLQLNYALKASVLMLRTSSEFLLREGFYLSSLHPPPLLHPSIPSTGFHHHLPPSPFHPSTPPPFPLHSTTTSPRRAVEGCSGGDGGVWRGGGVRGGSVVIVLCQAHFAWEGSISGFPGVLLLFKCMSSGHSRTGPSSCKLWRAAFF